MHTDSDDGISLEQAKNRVVIRDNMSLMSEK
jgi:hypothetical protein